MIYQAYAVKLCFTFIILTATLFSGCTDKLGSKGSKSENELIIPDFPSAKDQFQFAKMYQNSQLIAPELDRRRLQMNKIAQYYQRVITNFPNDVEYVPMTYLELGDCAAQSDELDLAISLYQKAQASTTDHFIHVRSQYSIGRIYDTQGRHVEAKSIYKGIMDRYGKSESGRIRDVVSRSANLYMTVHEKK